MLVATGVNGDGHREVLGVKVATSETKEAWNVFFADLVARGLTGVLLVTSDAHAGLVEAIAANLPGATWQRCRTHYAANLMSVCPKSAWGGVKAMLHSVYDQPDADAVHAQFDKLLDTVTGPLPAVAEHLDAARADVLAFTAFPKELWRQVWCNNPNERLNKEIRRRTDVVGIFPDRDAITRLVGAVLAEQHDEWAEGRRYLALDVLARARTPAPHPAPPPTRPTARTGGTQHEPQPRAWIPDPDSGPRSTPPCTPPEPRPASGTSTAAPHPGPTTSTNGGPPPAEPISPRNRRTTLLTKLSSKDQPIHHVQGLDREAKPFGDAFCSCHQASTAYLEADIFGGTGTQSVVAWRGGEVWLNPVVTEFGWPPPDPASSPQWAFNQALRQLGVDPGEAFHELDALNLGKHRHTEDWQDTD